MLFLAIQSKLASELTRSAPVLKVLREAPEDRTLFNFLPELEKQRAARASALSVLDLLQVLHRPV